jgi:hypothetical protein
LTTATGALIIGDAEKVAEKILYVNEAVGGLSRITFQMGVSGALAREDVKVDRASGVLIENSIPFR